MCLCTGCAPSYHQDLEQEVTQHAKDLYKQQLSETTKEELEAQCRKECYEEVDAESKREERKRYEAEVLGLAKNTLQAVAGQSDSGRVKSTGG